MDIRPRFFWIQGIALAAVVSCVQNILIVDRLGPGYQISMEAAQGVLDGYPHWKSYQSRVLGPGIVYLLALLLSDFARAYLVFTVATLWLAGLLAWVVGYRIGRTRKTAFLAVFLLNLLFTAALSPIYLYAWDYLNLVVWLTMIDFVICRRTTSWFLALFAVALFNREGALFIAVLIGLESPVRWLMGRWRWGPPVPFNIRTTLLGALCLGLGITILVTLRRTLLIEPLRVSDGPALLTFVENMGKVADVSRLSGPEMVVQLLVWAGLAWMLAGVSSALFLAWVNPERWAPYAVTALGLVCAQSMFGRIEETRVYIELIPTIVVALLEAGNWTSAQAAVDYPSNL